ncbi:MAPEG family protein [Sphingoaurantiacus capsulatus]|uniref:MAPEG family protein n=1 Tax=Sphingoaurantiacus capsulatus TaxID=1771310 RepID=A0ABV7XFH6_9SPHN
MFESHPYTVGALLFALLAYLWSIFRVGQARGKYGVQAPAVTGDPGFERAFRAQQNTVEQLILFLPLLALAAWLWGDRAAAIYGAVWSVGRILYVEGYAREAGKRALGFYLSGLLSMIVLLALIVTLVMRHF